MQPFRIEIPDTDLEDLRGGDFAAFEQPERFVAEVRAAFRAIRA